MVKKMNKNECMKIVESLVINTLDWQPLNTFESRNTRKTIETTAKYGSYGVYLVTTKDCLTDNVIDSNIGYVGKSSNLLARVYDIKGGEHGARKYYNSKNINIEDVYVKLLFTKEGDETILERIIHDENSKLFGYRFAWKEASGGNDGALTRVLAEIDKMDLEEDLRKIAEFVEEKAVAIYRNNWRNR